jgi:hypothetical protein
MFKKPEWLKSAAEREAEREAAKRAEALLRRAVANLHLIRGKLVELECRRAELEEMVKDMTKREEE